MSSLKKISKAKIIIALVILIAIIFGIYNLMWFHYIKTTFTPFFERMEGTEPDSISSFSGWELHRYQNYQGSDYTYTIAIPPYLNFGGYLKINTPMDYVHVDGKKVYTRDYFIDVMLFFPQSRVYSLGLTDRTVNPDSNINIGMAVDNRGRPLDRAPDDFEAELFEEWLVIYNKYHEPIIKLFRDAMELYGEDLLP